MCANIIIGYTKRSAQQGGKHALTKRKSCTESPCSVLLAVGIYNNIDQLLEYNAKEMSNRPMTFKRLQQIMNDNYDNPNFSIYHLSEYFHISISHLSTLFKKEMGMNFIDYLWNLRIKKAKEYLAETNLSIDEISTRVGYSSTSGFRKKFKSDTGISPAQYRETYQKDNVQ